MGCLASKWERSFGTRNDGLSVVVQSKHATLHSSGSQHVPEQGCRRALSLAPFWQLAETLDDTRRVSSVDRGRRMAAAAKAMQIRLRICVNFFS